MQHTGFTPTMQAPPPPTAVPCGRCGGEGSIPIANTMFNMHEDTWLPADEFEPCPACAGLGWDDSREARRAHRAHLALIEAYREARRVRQFASIIQDADQEIRRLDNLVTTFRQREDAAILKMGGTP